MVRQDSHTVVHQVEVGTLVVICQLGLTKAGALACCGLSHDLGHVSRLSVPRSGQFQLKGETDM